MFGCLNFLPGNVDKILEGNIYIVSINSILIFPSKLVNTYYTSFYFCQIWYTSHMKPNKRLGQYFLVDKKALAKVVTTAQITKSDVVLEIGPGTGLLTKELAARAQKVIAIEKDRHMVEILHQALKEYDNIKVIQGDILKLDPSPYTLNPYKLVANIPYYITSPIIRKFLEEKNQPSQIVLMVQKEVAQRICAKPPNMSILAVSVQFYATAKIISYVPKGCFWPVPNVDSAIIKIMPFAEVPATNPEAFFKIVKAGFSQPRKQLAGNLSKSLKIDKKKTAVWLLQNNIQPAQRAETLTIEDWKNLTNHAIIKP